jgi:ATP:corrinoid adenosyltransferase
MTNLNQIDQLNNMQKTYRKNNNDSKQKIVNINNMFKKCQQQIQQQQQQSSILIDDEIELKTVINQLDEIITNNSNNK